MATLDPGPCTLHPAPTTLKPGPLRLGVEGSTWQSLERNLPIEILRAAGSIVPYSITCSQGSGSRVQGPEFWVQGGGIRVQGPRYRVQGPGCEHFMFAPGTSLLVPSGFGPATWPGGGEQKSYSEDPLSRSASVSLVMSLVV